MVKTKAWDLYPQQEDRKGSVVGTAKNYGMQWDSAARQAVAVLKDDIHVHVGRARAGVRQHSSGQEAAYSRELECDFHDGSILDEGPEQARHQGSPQISTT
jgi:hypothetical protein